MPKRKSRQYPVAKTPRKPMTADGLENVISGLGTGRSKRSYTRFTPDALNGYGELEAAYASNWLAAAIVDYPADDATREWRQIKCKDADEIRAEEDRLMVQHKINDALTWSRLFGGSAILMITNQDFEKPLDVTKIRAGDLSRLVVLDRYQMYPGAINTWDILADNFLLPEYWTVWQGSQRIHHSHFVFFRGKKVPSRLRMQTLGWGDSELRRCMEELKDAISSKGGIAELMQEANLDVITANGLADSITTGQEDKISDRYTHYGMMKSIFKLSLLDGDEKLDRMTLNLSGVAPVLEQLKGWVVGCSGIPATRLFGEQAKGLGNEGAGDLNNYYDNVRAKQNTYLDPAIRCLDEVMVRSAVGTMPADYNYDWNRLYQPNRKEEAEARKIEAETASLYLDAGVIQRSQVMRNLEADELYHYPEGVIEALEEAEATNWEPESLEEAARQFEEEQRAANSELGKQTADAAPSPLYVSRKVKNAADIIKWAKSAGFKSTLTADDLHVTIVYSKSPVDWMAAGNAWCNGEDGSMHIQAGGPRMLEQFGDSAIVLTFSSSDLAWRHDQFKEIGASWDWPTYQPHITISYEGADLDISKIEPYQGPIVLGPEIFEPLDTEWRSKINED